MGCEHPRHGSLAPKILSIIIAMDFLGLPQERLMSDPGTWMWFLRLSR